MKQENKSNKPTPNRQRNRRLQQAQEEEEKRSPHLSESIKSNRGAARNGIKQIEAQQGRATNWPQIN